MFAAIDARDLNEIRRLYEENPNSLDYDGRQSWGPIQYAAYTNFPDGVKLIDSLDPTLISSPTLNDFNTLHFAVNGEDGDTWQITELVCGLAPELMEEPDVLGRSPMYEALYHGKVKCALVMHKMGFDDYFTVHGYCGSCVDMGDTGESSSRSNLGRALSRCRSLTEVLLLASDERPAPRQRREMLECILQ